MSAVEENLITGSLKLISGSNEDLSFKMFGSEMLLGRNITAPICLSHRSVSRNHCFFKYTAEGWSVRDNKSQNGTFVNDIKIGAEEFHPIKDGDCIYLGNPIVPECLTLRFQKHEPENLPDQIAAHLPDEIEETDLEAKNGDGFNAPLKNDLKRRSEENELQQKKHCTVADPINVNASNSPCTFAASLVSPMKSPHKSSLVNGIHNQKKKASTQKFMEFLNEIKTKSPEKRVTEMPEEVVIDSSLSLIGAECEVTEMDYSYSPSEDVYLDQDEYNADFSQDLSKVPGLQDKISCLEADLEKVKRELQEKNELLKAQAETEEKLKKEFEAKLGSLREEIFGEARAKLEEELICNICTEFLLKATVLGCSHTYCEYCIHQWKKKKRQCPICREPITTEYRVLLIDSLIDKLAESYEPGLVQKRKDLLEARSEKKEVGKKKKKSNRASPLNARRLRSSFSTTTNRSTSTSEVSNSSRNALSLLEERVDNILRDTLADSPLVMPEIPEVMILSDLSDLSDSDDDESVDGYGFYGGYGRCFNCGRRGHWANGCPEF